VDQRAGPQQPRESTVKDERSLGDIHKKGDDTRPGKNQRSHSKGPPGGATQHVYGNPGDRGGRETLARPKTGGGTGIEFQKKLKILLKTYKGKPEKRKTVRLERKKMTRRGGRRVLSHNGEGGQKRGGPAKSTEVRTEGKNLVLSQELCTLGKGRKSRRGHRQAKLMNLGRQGGGGDSPIGRQGRTRSGNGQSRGKKKRASWPGKKNFAIDKNNKTD